MINSKYISKTIRQFLTISIILVLSNCASDKTSTWVPKKKAHGPANQLIVVADKNLWEGPVGDTFQYYFSSAYPILPQPEPYFDLMHFTPEELSQEPVRKNRRTYMVLGNLNDESSSTSMLIKSDLGTQKIERAKTEATFNSTIGKNKWADGQTLVYLFGNSDDELTKNIKEKFPAIARRINERDKDIFVSTAYTSGKSESLKSEIKTNLGVEMDVPNDFIVALHDGNMMWLRKETDFLSGNIFLYKLPYKDKSQFTLEGIKAIRDSLGKKYVSTEIDKTYMRTNNVDLPMVTKVITLNDNYAIEARGVWDIVNDFMGGPFLSYIIHNPNTNELLYVDGFIHAPGKKKRDHIQAMEQIFSTIKF